MDELEISGKRFLSTRRAGKEHKYHADYIGQLVRGKKVAGQKVGRAWYVDAESLAEYLGKEYTPPSQKKSKGEKLAEKSVEEKVEKKIVEVEPMVVEAIVEAEPVAVVEVKEEQSGAEIFSVDVVEEKTSDTFAPGADVQDEVVETVEEKEETQIPINVSTPVKVKKFIGGLRYVADDMPLVPRVRAAKRELAQVAPHVEEHSLENREEMAEEVSEVSEAPTTARISRIMPIGSLLVLGVATLVVITSISVTLSSITTIEPEKGTASVSYSFR